MSQREMLQRIREATRRAAALSREERAEMVRRAAEVVAASGGAAGSHPAVFDRDELLHARAARSPEQFVNLSGTMVVGACELAIPFWSVPGNAAPDHDTTTVYSATIAVRSCPLRTVANDTAVNLPETALTPLAA